MCVCVVCLCAGEGGGGLVVVDLHGTRLGSGSRRWWRGTAAPPLRRAELLDFRLEALEQLLRALGLPRRLLLRPTSALARRDRRRGWRKRASVAYSFGSSTLPALLHRRAIPPLGATDGVDARLAQPFGSSLAPLGAPHAAFVSMGRQEAPWVLAERKPMSDATPSHCRGPAVSVNARGRSSPCIKS